MFPLIKFCYKFNRTKNFLNFSEKWKKGLREIMILVASLREIFFIYNTKS